VTGPGSICHPIILPSITPDLQKKLDNIRLLKAQKNFIAFWAAHLSHVTNQWPTKSDYQNFAQSIVAAYPALADVGGGCVIYIFNFSIITFAVLLIFVIIFAIFLYFKNISNFVF